MFLVILLNDCQAVSAMNFIDKSLPFKGLLYLIFLLFRLKVLP